MRYRLTCLTPTLVGDGSHLSPIDYMVWRDQVNVLDQTRIVRLLAKGPRLDNYLKQIQRATKLDFAAWGGFAQNFAGRRIPFEDPAYSRYWEALASDQLRIPSFASSAAGPYLPGSALKGALRTALVSARVTEAALEDLAGRTNDDRARRMPGPLLEELLAGASGANQWKPFSVGDSDPVSRDCFRIFMLRTASLAPAGDAKLSLRWKQAPRGDAPGSRPDQGSACFAEMAAPGSEFTGRWRENPFYQQPEVLRALRLKATLTTAALLEAANDSAEKILEIHVRYAQAAGLAEFQQNLESLRSRVAEARRRPGSAVLCVGWGAGFLSKSGGGSPSHAAYRRILEQLPYFSRAVRSGLPFPKTRRVVFLRDRPATLPGWCLLEVRDA